MSYIKLNNKSIFYEWFVYVDIKDYLADILIRKYNIRIKIVREFHRTDDEYVAIVCKIRKPDVHNFYKAMQELENNMCITGHTDYEEFCKDFKDMLYKEANKECSKKQRIR